MKHTINTNSIIENTVSRRSVLSTIRGMSLVVTAIAFGFNGTGIEASDQVPGSPQKGPIAIRNGTIHTVSGEAIQGGTLIFKDGKISEIGTDLAIAEGVEVIDAAGKHVYPGLIDAYSSLGLVEIESIRATIDTTEGGQFNPNVRAAVAVNPDSEAIPVARANGVLIALVAPTGGLVSGRSALMFLDGWTWESMTLQPDTAMIVNWPRFSAAPRGRFRRDEAEGAGAGSETDRLAPLHELIREAKAYAAARKAAPDDTSIDLRLEAVVPIVEGKLPILINANAAKQIQTAVAFVKQYGLKAIIVGGADAVQSAHLLREANIPVIVSSVYRLPSRHDSPYDAAYSLPAQLKEAGVQFAIAGDGRFGASGVRNLPYHAAASVAFGLSEADALRSITLSPAEIFGVADRTGSLDVGKDATLIIADGNILETSSNVQHAFIQGRKVDLSSKHTQLYEKYQKKYQK